MKDLPGPVSRLSEHGNVKFSLMKHNPHRSSDNMTTSTPTTATTAQFSAENSQSTKQQNSEAGKIL